jgi:tetratricopeptide (TPR) repeat protein
VSIKHIRLLAALSALLISRGTWGQNAEAESVKGEVHVSGSTTFRGEVTLGGLRGGPNIAPATVGADGRFEFRHLPYGQYRLTVLDAGKPVHEEVIAVRAQQPPIEIEVAAPEDPKPASGSVSARELLHPPAKKALKAFAAAQKLSAAGEHEQAAEQLAKATQLSPDYAEAWIDLGSEHIYLKRYRQALEELAKASEISRPTAAILSDMAFAQYALYRYAEGTRSVREALRLDPSWIPAHYLLGWFLAQDRQTRAEGIQHLERAAAAMPAAQAELDRALRDSVQPLTNP